MKTKTKIVTQTGFTATKDGKLWGVLGTTKSTPLLGWISPTDPRAITIYKKPDDPELPKREKIVRGTRTISVRVGPV